MSVAVSQTAGRIDDRSLPTLVAVGPRSTAQPASNRTTMVLHVTMPGLLEALTVLAQPTVSTRPIVLASTKAPIIRACSRSARTHGVRRGMPLPLAKRRCPNVEVFYADLDARHRGLEHWLEPIAAFSPAVERVESDTVTLRIRVAGEAMAQRVALRLRSTLDGVFPDDARIGFGPNDIVARGAVRSATGSQIVGMRESTYREWASRTPVQSLPGISREVATRLAALGVHTGGQLARVSIGALTDCFGCKADRLIAIARGENRAEIDPVQDHAAPGTTARGPVPRMELVT